MKSSHPPAPTGVASGDLRVGHDPQPGHAPGIAKAAESPSTYVQAARDFSALVELLPRKAIEASICTGVHVDTVRRWMSGETDVPLQAYLALQRRLGRMGRAA